MLIKLSIINFHELLFTLFTFLPKADSKNLLFTSSTLRILTCPNIFYDSDLGDGRIKKYFCIQCLMHIYVV